MLMTLTTLILAAVILALLAVAMGWILGWANRTFHVEVDPKLQAINEALPGANCGGCGFVGCGEYAEAIVAGKTELTLCAPGGAGCVELLAKIMGIEVGDSLPYRPVVHCVARYNDRKGHNEYRGEATCQAANMIADVQGCAYGCLGLGDCKAACKYDAIKIEDGLSIIDYTKCVGCKACAKVCPRNIITMTPFKSERILVIACSNQDFGKDVKEVCNVGCIGCKACSRLSDVFQFKGEAKLPSIDYDSYRPGMDFQEVMDKCPMKGMLYVGKPTDRDIDATKDEEAPQVVTVDFKTTVDDAEWRG